MRSVDAKHSNFINEFIQDDQNSIFMGGANGRQATTFNYNVEGFPPHALLNHQAASKKSFRIRG